MRLTGVSANRGAFALSNMNAKATVVVLTRNGNRWIHRCLTSLLRTNYPNFAVLVVDNASSDGTPQTVSTHFPAVTLLEQARNHGSAEGNNIGIRAMLNIGSDYVALLDQDTWVDPDWLGELVSVAGADPRIGVLCPSQWDYEGMNLDATFLKFLREVAPGAEFQIKEPASPQVIQVPNIVGAGFLLTRSMMERVGLFDPMYFAYFEEVDLCRRARKKGFQIAVAPRSKIYHWHSFHHPQQTSRKIKILAVRNRFVYALKDPQNTLWTNIGHCLREYVKEFRYCIHHPKGLSGALPRAFALTGILAWLLFKLPVVLDHRRCERNGAAYLTPG